MHGTRTISQLAFAFAALLLPVTALACDAPDFTSFRNCMSSVPPGEGIRLTANIAPDSSAVNVSLDRTVDNNGFGLTGSGAFIKSGSATLTLPTANGSFLGAVHITAGTVAIGAANSLGSGPLNLYGAGGTLLVLGSFNPTSASINLQAGSSKIAAVSGATTRLFSVGSVNTVAVTFGDPVNNGTLEFSGTAGVSANTTVTLAGGNVRALDAQLPTLMAKSVTMAAGSKIVANVADFNITDLQGAGEIALGIGRTLTVHGGTYSGVISGFGTLAKGNTGAADLTLLGTNTYSGGTTIAAGGALHIGNGGTTGTLGSGNVFIFGELDFNRTGASEISDQVTGNGVLRVQAGALTLSNASSSFAGFTVVDVGTLSVNGSLGLASSSITIANGGTLTGYGTMGSVFVDGGSVHPGPSPGAMATGMLYLASSGGTTLLELDINGNVPGVGYDKFDASGQVTLVNPTLSIVAPYTPVAGDSFVLINNLSGSPISGTFLNIPEGAATTINGVPMRYSYVGGDGDDFVLSVLTRTVTPTVVPHGTITPDTPKLVIDNTTTTFLVVPDTGYTATVDGSCPPGALVGTTYTTGVITTNCSVTPFFAPMSYTITSSGGPNGTIFPGSQSASHDGTTGFIVTPVAGYSATFGGTCALGSLVGTIYTTGTITGPCNVTVTFTLNAYSVTSSGGPNGTITPPTQPVNHGSTTTFTVTPGTGYTATMGGTCPAGSLVGQTYTTGAITGPCNVTASFSLSSYTVTSSAGPNGTITPPTQPVLHGNTTVFIVTPSTGYTASVGGTCPGGSLVGPIYTTGPITGPCNVTATFTINTYTVTASSGSNGTITPPTRSVGHGATTTFTVTPSASYSAAVGGSCGGALVGTTYTTNAITADCTVTAVFTLDDPPRLGNISTRMQVLTGNDVMIGGFVIGGSTTKRVAIVATGPSLVPFGITNALANPTLSLVRSSDQTVLAASDDWQSAANSAQLTAAGFAPSNTLEAAILVDLAPGAYTAIVQGASGGTGVAVIGVYEVDHPETPLINISTRGRVLTGNDVMIGGFIINGTGAQTVAIVATGPSLAAFGIASPLANPTITLVRSSDQAVIATNDDWQTDANASLLQAAGFAPTSPLESALHTTLPPGAYTVVVQGAAGGTGVAVIGVYKVN